MTADGVGGGAHQDLLMSVGALALGTLEPAEQSHVRAHLAACSECQEAYNEVVGVPRLLALVSAAEAASGPPEPDDGLLDRLLAAVRRERREERIRRVRFAVGASLAAAACAVGIVIGVQQLSGGPGQPDAVPTISASGSPSTVASATDTPAEVLSASDAATGVSASVALSPVAWGTRVDLTLRGVQPGYVCSLVAVGSDGVREVASTWTVPEGGYPGKGNGPGELSIGGAIGLDRAAITHFEIVEDTGELLLTIPA